MIEGFFYVQFSTPQSFGAGVIVLRNGQVLGGDGALYYSGVYTHEAGKLQANIRTGRHTPGNLSLFGIDVIDIEFRATVADDLIIGQGVSPQAPDVAFTVRLGRISPA